MIYIANPIFDPVFKYMMDDEEVAKRFIGIIIGKKIKSIKLRPQEKAYRKDDVTSMLIQRLDFIAEVIDENKKKSKVLIEVQKSNRAYHADVMRFRGYLAQQYQSDDLPIITIYILGFELKDLTSPAVHVNSECKDLYYEKPISKTPEFVEKLTHQCYVIQVPRLKPVLKNKLTELLDLFNQEYRVSGREGRKTLSVPYIPKDKDISVIVKRLEKANADEELRQKIQDDEFTDMAYEEMFGKLDRKLARLERKIKKNEKELDEKQKALDEKQKALDEKQKALDEKQKALDEKQKALEQEKQRSEQEKQRAEQEKQRAEQEKQRAEQEKQRAEQEKQRAEQEKQRAEQLEQEKVLTVKKLIQKGMSTEEIIQITSVDMNFLKKHGLI